MESGTSDKVRMQVMRVIIIVAALCAVWGLSAFAFAEGDAPETAAEGDRPQGGGPSEVKGDVAAKVNGVVITHDAVVKMMRRIMSSGSRGPATAKDMETVREEALNKLVTQELAYQKAKAEGAVADPKEIDASMADLKKRLGGEEGLKAYLEKESLTEEGFRTLVERSLILKVMYAREVTDRIVISEDDLKKEFEAEKDKYAKPEKVTITDVVFFLSLEDDDSPKKVEGVLKKIGEDKDKNPWSLKPDGTFIVRDIEVAMDNEKELYESARKLNVGEISGVIKTYDSFHIVKLKEYSPRQEASFEGVRVFLENEVRAKATGKRLHEWEAELRKEAKIEVMEPEASKK